MSFGCASGENRSWSESFVQSYLSRRTNDLLAVGGTADKVMWGKRFLTVQMNIELVLVFATKEPQFTAKARQRWSSFAPQCQCWATVNSLFADCIQFISSASSTVAYKARRSESGRRAVTAALQADHNLLYCRYRKGRECQHLHLHHPAPQKQKQWCVSAVADILYRLCSVAV